MNRRNGLTLVEVLTALFILALGVIAILTMFPLGASQMAFAVRDNRSTEAAFNADSYMRTYWKTQVVEQPNGGTEPFYLALNDPNNGPGAGSPHPGLAILNNTETDPSYPVLVDPMGYVARPFPPNSSNPTTLAYWLGDNPTGPPLVNVPRRNLNAMTSNPLAQRTCTLMDTLGYNSNGVPGCDDFGNPTDDREMRYNWLWIIQRPTNTNRFTANMTIVVFDRRAHLYAPVGSEAVFPNVAATPGTNSLVFGASPDIKPGAWIMDATIGSVVNPVTNATVIIRNTNFYRVTAVNGTQVELQSPVKTLLDGSKTPYSGTFVVLRGVSGVYSRSPLTAGD